MRDPSKQSCWMRAAGNSEAEQTSMGQRGIANAPMEAEKLVRKVPPSVGHWQR
jgi:hypothetical protein